jgi:hypothetical protein
VKWIAIASIALAVGARSDLTPSLLTVAPGDIPGAALKGQGPIHEKGYTSGYQRSFTFKSPNGSSGLVFFEDEALVAPTIARAANDVVAVRSALSKPAGRAAFVASIAANLNVKPSQVKPGALRTVRVGDSSVELPVSVQLSTRRVYESLAYVQLDRVVSVIVSAGIRPIAAADTRRIAAAGVKHINAALTPQAFSKPSVTGDAVVGSVLAAKPGTWSDQTAKLSYQWQRCDASGANCAAIAGATDPTYTAVDADTGSTLRVEVTATNRFGSAKADSDVTAAVTAPPPPQ